MAGRSPPFPTGSDLRKPWRPLSRARFQFPNQGPRLGALCLSSKASLPPHRRLHPHAAHRKASAIERLRLE